MGRALLAALRRTARPPLDGCRVAATWGSARRVGGSGDVPQARWHPALAGFELPGTNQRRIATHPVRMCGWEVAARLTDRPSAPLTSAVASASPTYDLTVTGTTVWESTIRTSRGRRP